MSIRAQPCNFLIRYNHACKQFGGLIEHCNVKNNRTKSKWEKNYIKVLKMVLKELDVKTEQDAVVFFLYVDDIFLYADALLKISFHQQLIQKCKNLRPVHASQ